MNKDKLLKMIASRLTELEEQYKSVGDNGYTYGSTKVMRNKIKKDTCILTLIQEILLQSKDSCKVSHEDSIYALDKLLKL